MAEPKVYVDVQFNLKNGSVEAISYLVGRDRLDDGDEWIEIEVNESPELTEMLEVRVAQIASVRTTRRVVTDDKG